MNDAESSQQVQDPSHDVLRSEGHPLDPLFKPRSVAVIGATPREGTVGRTLLSNLRETSFRGKVWPVNPQHAEILGLPCVPAVGKISFTSSPGRTRK